MRFHLQEQLIRNGGDAYCELRSNALQILSVALDTVDPKVAIQNKIRIDREFLSAGEWSCELASLKRILVIGGGKAGGAMAEAVESLLGERVTAGIVNILKGTEAKYTLKKIRLLGTSHPVPDRCGANGVEEMLNLVANASKDDLIIVLISGGGSAIMPCPADGISLEDIQTITSKLLKKGATINDLNAVRKHLDVFKGGQLAKRCGSARILSIILSDVVEDPLDIIASGPTSPDSSTWFDAIDVLKKYDVWENSPRSVRNRLEKGIRGEIEETPKVGDPVFEKVFNFIVANNSGACEAAVTEATRLGYNGLILSTMIEGEARHVGSVYAGIAREVSSSGRPVKTPAALVLGGETTVEVRGSGRGGRNQEVAISVAQKISGLNCVVACLATDGVDGPTDAAGAIVDGNTLKRAQAANLSIDFYLKENDSYSFFNHLGDLIVTGPTGTNVNDLTLILIGAI